MTESEIHRYWKEIIDAIDDGIFIIGPDGVIMAVNKGLERMLGYTRDEIVGQGCGIFNCDVCEAARAGGSGKWCQLFEVGLSRKKRCLVGRKDGSYISAYKKASLIRDEHGEVLGAVETLTDLSELDKRDQKIEALSKLVDTDNGFHGIIGKSGIMQRVYFIVEKAAMSDAPVIIFGESGTGKELVARAIHELGRRREGPYIQLNCAALNESLLESELFGHVKGAFTGAYRHRQGRFEAAHGGDIFLDEIGDIPLPIQVKLLRVLETKQFERVGDHQPISMDTRIIAATHRDLNQLVSEGKFREDLFFRINVIPINLPPLRDRMMDVPILVGSFIKQLRQRTGKDISGLTPEAMKRFMSYEWPGNVRELKSAIEYAFVLAERGLIDTEQLPVHMVEESSAVCRPCARNDLDGAERTALIEALKSCGCNQSQAAKLLGISRVTVWNRMRKYAINPKKLVN